VPKPTACGADPWAQMLAFTLLLPSKKSPHGLEFEVDPAVNINDHSPLPTIPFRESPLFLPHLQ
jgi:hypothetical protein